MHGFIIAYFSNEHMFTMIRRRLDRYWAGYRVALREGRKALDLSSFRGPPIEGGGLYEIIRRKRAGQIPEGVAIHHRIGV